MRNLIEIEILEIALHVLESRSPVKLTLADYPLQIAGNQLLIDYFCEHIRTSLNEPVAKAARFRAIQTDHASGISADILAGRVSLLDGSRQLAQLLFDVMITNSRITPADLAVCLFYDRANPQIQYLAILKIDPSKVFEQEIIEDEFGRIRINFKINEKAFTKEKLQKCAFCRPLDTQPRDYDMLLLDRQTGEIGDGEIAKFFMERFLEAEDAYDAKSRTKLLYTILTDAHSEISLNLPGYLNDEIDQRIRSAVNNTSINIDRWIEDLPLIKGYEYIKEFFKTKVIERIPDREFNLNSNFAAELTKRRTFIGENGLRVSVFATNFKKMFEITEEITPEGVRLKRIVIKSMDFKEVVR